MIENTLERIATALEVIAKNMNSAAPASQPAPAPQPQAAPPAAPEPQPTPAPQPAAPVPTPALQSAPAAPAQSISLDDARAWLRQFMADPNVGKFAANIISTEIQKFGVMDISSLAKQDASKLSELIANVENALKKVAGGN